MSNRSDKIHNALLHRLVTTNSRFSDDERRDLYVQLADAASDIENPKSEADLQAERDAEKQRKRAELEAQIAALDS